MEQNKLSVPAAIVIAGIIIAGAVIWNGQHGQNASQPQEPKYTLDKTRPIDASDHVRGNLDAPITIVEYSDLECPFCKEFHKTLDQTLQKYGDQVALVYRHFPLTRLHSQAEKEAEASECVAMLGGNDKFWQYTDKIFEVTPSNNGLDLSLLPKIATDLGIDGKAFNDCLSSNQMAAKVKADSDNAQAIGAQGTPFSVVITKKGKQPLGGYLPFEEMQKFIEQQLKA